MRKSRERGWLIVLGAVLLVLGLAFVALDGLQSRRAIENVPRERFDTKQSDGVEDVLGERARREVMPPATSSQNAVDGAIRIDCTYADDGRGLGGVLVEVRSDLKVARGVTSDDGLLVVSGLPDSMYMVTLSHDSCIPVASSAANPWFVRPGADTLRVSWCSAYVYGLKLPSGVVDVRFDPKGWVDCCERPVLEVTEAFRGLVSRMSRDFASGVNEYVYVTALSDVGPYPARRATLFDRHKGPIEVLLPLVRIEEFRGVHLIDTAGYPAKEAMGSIVLRVVDSRGRDVDIGVQSAIRVGREPYHGFISASLRCGQETFVPPGDYDVSGSPYYPGAAKDRRRIRVGAGEQVVVDRRLDAPYGRTVLRFARHGDVYSYPVGVQIVGARSTDGRHALGQPRSVGNESVMFLPAGVTSLAITYGDPGSGEALRHLCEVTVLEVEGDQLALIDLP